MGSRGLVGGRGWWPIWPVPGATHPGGAGKLWADSQFFFLTTHGVQELALEYNGRSYGPPDWWTPALVPGDRAMMAFRTRGSR